ncbi:hypothetical protein [Chroococcus sp. FPU101]|uniref:hypothetical protein n=1 Tax=Chroococcus sp. FPU101 TaxID=1974212 RepID=UPI001A8ECC48|nr:hypothetical protein [Chroococcus sp. FPU101]GFE67916.1 hypothetical protein CFPU101_05260 [Chroococcus sp. FPU101]
MYKFLGLITLLGGILTTGVAWAIPSEVNLSLKRQETENYEQFIQRAQTLTSNTIQQRFKNNQSLEEVRVVVIGENKGAIAPILTVEVNRNNWNTDPSIKRWQNDFPFSRELLGFEQPQAQMEPSVPIEVPTSEPETPDTSDLTPEPPDTPETTDTPEKNPPTPSPAELVPLPYPDQVPSTDTPPIPLPNQRLQPNRIR